MLCVLPRPPFERRWIVILLLTRIEINQWTRRWCVNQFSDMVWCYSGSEMYAAYKIAIWDASCSCTVPSSAVMSSTFKLPLSSRFLQDDGTTWQLLRPPPSHPPIPRMKKKVQVSISLDLYLAWLNQSGTDYWPDINCKTILCINFH